MTELSVVIGSEEVSVTNVPATIELTTDIGASGTPGSQIYVVDVSDPNDVNQLSYIDGYPYVSGNRVNVGDILINYDSQGFPKIHQYAVVNNVRTFALVTSLQNLVTAAAYPGNLTAISFDELASFIVHSEHVNATVTADYDNNKIIVATDLTVENVQDYIAPLFIHSSNTGIDVSYDDVYNKIVFAINMEYFQDSIASMFTNNELVTNNVVITYDDIAGKFTISVPDKNIHNVSAQTLTHNLHTNITVTYDDIAEQVTLNGLTDEQIQDLSASLLNHTNHTDLTVTYDDANNQLVLSAAYGSEAIQDIAASLLNHTDHVNVTVNYDDAANKVIISSSYSEAALLDSMESALVHNSHQNISVVRQLDEFVFSFSPDATATYTDKEVSTGSIGGLGAVILSTVQIDSVGGYAINATGTVPYMVSTASGDKYKIFISESDSDVTVGTLISSSFGAHQTGNTVSATWVPTSGIRYVHLCAQRISGSGTFTAFADAGTTYGKVNMVVRQVW